MDKTRLRNYDIVCDSTSAGPEEIVERIAGHLTAQRLYAPEPLCYLDPRRIRQMANGARDGSVQVVYVAPDFFAVGGRDRIEATTRAGERLIEAALVAEADEEIDGRGCHDHLRSHMLG